MDTKNTHEVTQDASSLDPIVRDLLEKMALGAMEMGAMEMGFATGHGETQESILHELELEINELRYRLKTAEEERGELIVTPLTIPPRKCARPGN